MKDETSAPVICLAASGGGHLRQIMDLMPFWQAYPHFIVTEETPFGRSVAARVETEFVPHFAIGQARLGAPLRMLANAWKGLWRSLAIIRKRRPDYVITTGAGSQAFIVLWARLLGARIILIDSFARFEKPSKFARICGPLAHHRIAQSASVVRHWPGAELFNPLREIPTASTGGKAKEDLLFATVGATLSFPRLTNLVIAAKKSGTISEEVILQVGQGVEIAEQAQGLTIVEELPFEEIKKTLARARIVICHGGTGSIITALQNACATIVIPRTFERGEHYDNHQLEIAESFQDRGLTSTANDHDDLAAAIAAARQSAPVAVTTDYEPMIKRLEQLLRAPGPSVSDL